LISILFHDKTLPSCLPLLHVGGLINTTSILCGYQNYDISLMIKLENENEKIIISSINRKAGE
ncbi:hypothetical protein, partial [Thomasclavelia cocleata]|uniref:hypothetical protein n=1 Tax=Thomasclavelia cocleata TaxID=69824 RepID=UPI00242BDAA0